MICNLYETNTFSYVKHTKGSINFAFSLYLTPCQVVIETISLLIYGFYRNKRNTYLIKTFGSEFGIIINREYKPL